MIDGKLESADGDLAEVRDKIEATRAALERALEAADSDELREAVTRLERIEASVARVEWKVAERVGVRS